MKVDEKAFFESHRKAKRFVKTRLFICQGKPKVGANAVKPFRKRDVASILSAICLAYPAESIQFFKRNGLKPVDDGQEA